MLLITGSDQYIGYCIVSHLAQHEKLRSQLRVTCQSKRKCYGFSNVGIDVREIEYDHPNQLSLALRGIDQVIIAVGNEKNRVECAKHVCQAAAQSGVTSIICISHIGAASQSHPSLLEFNEIEQEVMNSNCQYTIIRLDFVQQYFHLWSNYAEKHRQWMLPFNETIEMSPVDITDVCKVIESICLDNENQKMKALEDKHDGQVYTITGPERVNGKRIVEYLIKATGYQRFKYHQSRPMDLSYYMSGLGKDVWFDSRIKQEMSQIYHDDYCHDSYRSKVYSNPTDKQIQTYLDYFDWLQQISSNVSVPHLRMFIDSNGKSLEEFFKENAISFKPRV